MPITKVTPEKTNDGHFSDIYKFIYTVVIFGMIVSLATIFIPIPKENQRFADTVLIFWLSTAVSSGISYLIGNSASTGKKKDEQNTGETSQAGDTVTIDK